MSYKNEIICYNCGSRNAEYEYKCSNCKAFLRDRIVNIDLGETILRIIDSPAETFRKIKFSEHKNYIFFLLFFLSIRFLIISRFISVPFVYETIKLNTLLLILISFGITIILFLLLSFLLQKIFLLLSIKTRFKDILAVIIYSLLPNLLALLILFPTELVFYGEYLFSNNPYPYQIKESVFYFILVIEALTLVWSIFLVYIGIKEFVKVKLFSFTISVLLWLAISLVLFLQSKLFLI
ncbi:MAG: YIP1 family protein [Ignavibacterium sp.]|uniref:YIP1 family protein n=1 Tax=Ignavibacterium sp. TaxID=2651167 RepID=UPI0040495ABF